MKPKKVMGLPIKRRYLLRNRCCVAAACVFSWVLRCSLRSASMSSRPQRVW